MTTMFPHQERIRDHILQTWKRYPKRGCIVRADAGIGKTVACLLSLLDMYTTRGHSLSCLVIVPSNILLQWKTEWITRLGLPPDMVGIYHGKGRTVHMPHPILLTSHTILLYDLKNHVRRTSEEGQASLADTVYDRCWDVCVIDEAHRFGNLVRSNTACGRDPPMYCYVFAELRYAFAILLTATPFGRGVDNICSMLRMIRADSLVRPQLNVSVEQIYRTFTIDITRAQMGTGARMPTTTIQSTYFEFTGSLQEKAHALQAEHTKIQAKLKRALRQRDYTSVASLRTLCDVSATRQRLFDSSGQATKEDLLAVPLDTLRQHPKHQWLLQFLRRLATTPYHATAPHTHRVVVTSAYTSVLYRLRDLVTAALGDTAFGLAMFTGDTELHERSRIQQAFNESTRPCILLLSKQAGGTGLNLCGAHMIVFDPAYKYIEDEQAIGRVQRLGQSHHVGVHFLAMRHGIEESLRQLQYGQLLETVQYVPSARLAIDTVYLAWEKNLWDRRNQTKPDSRTSGTPHTNGNHTTAHGDRNGAPARHPTIELLTGRTFRQSHHRDDLRHDFVPWTLRHPIPSTVAATSGCDKANPGKAWRCDACQVVEERHLEVCQNCRLLR
jgi:hypothetical protein